MAYISGHYACTYNGTSIGGTREGFRMIQTNHHQPVISDAAGEMQVDGVQQGADIIVELDYIEYDLILPALIAQVGAQGTCQANVGKLLSGLAKPLVLTAAAGTPAATLDGIKVYTFYLAIVVDDVEVLLASKLRQGRVRFRCFPDPAHSNNTYAYA